MFGLSHIEAVLFIIVVNLIVFFRTMKYNLIVDDVRHTEDIAKGYLRVRWENKLSQVLQVIGRRLYGAGTFTTYKTCDRCGGKKKLLVKDKDGKETLQDCVKCNKFGEIIKFNLPLEHFFSTFLHATVCVLMYVYFGVVMGRGEVGFWAALLYAVNPTNTATSVWLNGRRYAVVIIATVLMLIGYTVLPYPLNVIPLALYFVGLAYQVTGFFSPVLLGIAPVILIPIAMLLGRDRAAKFYRERVRTIVNDDLKSFGVGKWIVVVKSFGWYLTKMIVPVRTFVVYNYLNGWGMTKEGNRDAYSFDGFFFAGLAYLSVIGYALVRTFWTIEFNYILFILLGTLQWCNIIVMTQVCTDRYASLVNVFVMYFVAKICCDAAGWIGGNYAVVFLVYYLANLHITLDMFKGMMWFHNYHTYYDKVTTTIRKFKVNMLIKKQPPDVTAAFETIKEGLFYNPNDFALLYQMAVVLRMMGSFERSNEYVKRARMNYYINQGELWEKELKALEDANDLCIKDMNKMQKDGDSMKKKHKK